MIKYVDFDGTLAYYDKWLGFTKTGTPIASMVEKVKKWLKEGHQVVIFTARLTSSLEYGEHDLALIKLAINCWCMEHFGQYLPITNVKGPADEFYDDRAFRIVRNTGLTEGEYLATIIAEELKSDSTKEQSLNKILETINKNGG
jgi:hypothetical protein